MSGPITISWIEQIMQVILNAVKNLLFTNYNIVVFARFRVSFITISAINKHINIFPLMSQYSFTKSVYFSEFYLTLFLKRSI